MTKPLRPISGPKNAGKLDFLFWPSFRKIISGSFVLWCSATSKIRLTFFYLDNISYFIKFSQKTTFKGPKIQIFKIATTVERNMKEHEKILIFYFFKISVVHSLQAKVQNNGEKISNLSNFGVKRPKKTGKEKKDS